MKDIELELLEKSMSCHGIELREELSVKPVLVVCILDGDDDINKFIFIFNFNDGFKLRK